jgi:hypothetical protein
MFFIFPCSPGSNTHGGKYRKETASSFVVVVGIAKEWDHRKSQMTECTQSREENGMADRRCLDVGLFLSFGSMEILVIIVVHLLVAFLLGGLDEVDVLAAGATRAVDDVVGGDGFEVIVGSLLIFFIFVLCLRESRVSRGAAEGYKEASSKRAHHTCTV